MTQAMSGVPASVDKIHERESAGRRYVIVPSSPGNTGGGIIGAEDDAVIEVLGAGVQDGRKTWLLRDRAAYSR